MPRLYDCLLLAKSLKSDIQLPGYFDFYVDSSSLKVTEGYYGKIYIDNMHEEILFVHRSTSFGSVQQYEDSSFVAIQNIISDSSIYLQYLPSSSNVALKFINDHLTHLLEKYSGYTFVQVGHSLGGFHAHICGYLLKHRVIAIDPPGCAEIILKLKNTFDHLQCEKHHSFFVHRNQINETNCHIGKLAYHHYKPYWEETSSSRMISHTLETHTLDYFMEHIPEDSEDSSDGLPDSFFWYTAASPVMPLGLFFNQTFASDTLPVEIENSIILGSQENVDKNKWLVFMLNEKQRAGHQNGQHAFLLLEGIKDGVHVLARYELVTADRTHASILMRENYQEVIQELEDSHKTRRWQYKYAAISRNKAEQLVRNICDDYQKGVHNKLFFDLLGTDSKADCYNCVRWVKEKFKQIGATFIQNDFVEFYTTYLINKPSKAVKGGHEFVINENEVAPETSCCIF